MIITVQIELLGRLVLWMLPLAAFVLTRWVASHWTGRATGVAFGLIASPATTGLYGLYFVNPVVALIGLVGLPLALIHGTPGYELSIALGIVPQNTIVEGRLNLYVEVLNGVIWGFAYGLLGWFVDWLRSRRRRANTAPLAT